MNNFICPNCRSEDVKKYLSTKDYFLTQDVFEINECLNCEVLFTHPIPEPEVLYSKYYKSENYLSHNKKSSDLFSAAYRVVQKINIRMKLNLVEKANKSSKKKILEIGAGTGDFLAACQRRGWNCFGVEPSAQASVVAQEFNKLKLHSSISEVGERNFSVIALWHVLEHIPDLSDTILKLNNLLTDNGKLIIAVPNHNSFDAKHYNQYWAGYDVPRHLYHFSKKSLPLIMEEKGFQLIKTRPMVFDSFYVSFLSEKYKRTNFIIKYLKGILFGLLSNISASVTGESSSLIFVFQKSK